MLNSMQALSQQIKQQPDLRFIWSESMKHVDIHALFIILMHLQIL